MPCTVEITKRAEKQLARINKPTAERIAQAVAALADDPRPNGCKKLVGDGRWRIRVGDYRILYTIEDDKMIVTVVDVAHRREIYRRR